MTHSGFILLMFLFFVYIIRLFYRHVCFISNGLVGVEVNIIFVHATI